ncbi:hypothetical protein D3C81_1681160 [compost metagenome]
MLSTKPVEKLMKLLNNLRKAAASKHVNCLSKLSRMQHVLKMRLLMISRVKEIKLSNLFVVRLEPSPLTLLPS